MPSILDYSVTAALTLVISLVVAALELADEAKVRVKQVFIQEFWLFYIVMSGLNIVTALFAIHLVESSSLATLNLVSKWFLSATAGVFAVQGIASQISVSFWGAGVAAIHRWRERAKKYVGKAILEHRSKAAARLQVRLQRYLEDKGLEGHDLINSWTITCFTPDEIEQIEKQAARKTLDPTQLKISKLIVSRREFVVGALDEIERQDKA